MNVYRAPSQRLPSALWGKLRADIKSKPLTLAGVMVSHARPTETSRPYLPASPFLLSQIPTRVKVDLGWLTALTVGA